MKIVAHITRFRRDIPNFFGNTDPPIARTGEIKTIDGEFVTICCLDMDQALKKGLIGFGQSFPILPTKNLNKKLNIRRHTHPDPMNPEPENDETAIQYCPFCSEKIEIFDNELNQVGDTLIK